MQEDILRPPDAEGWFFIYKNGKETAFKAAKLHADNILFKVLPGACLRPVILFGLL